MCDICKLETSGTFIDLESYQELEIENARLREALEKITDLHADDGIYMLGIAYEALQGKEE
jgi:hypothetical protein